MLSNHYPSKTFLLGEYAVLASGCAVVISHEPYFTASWQAKSDVCGNPFHPESPAGKFYCDHQSALGNQQLSFFDPHQGRGGFGASSAAFLACYQAVYAKSESPGYKQKLLDCYRNYARGERGQLPSGADVIAQSLPCGIHWIDTQQGEIKTLDWPFADLTLTITPTGNKIATHEHLATLAKPSLEELISLTRQGYQQLRQGDEAGFLTTINDYRNALQQQGWLANETQSQIARVLEDPEVLAAKGCGAMGADVIIQISKNRNHSPSGIIFSNQL